MLFGSFYSISDCSDYHRFVLLSSLKHMILITIKRMMIAVFKINMSYYLLNLMALVALVYEWLEHASAFAFVIKLFFP